MRFSQQIDYLMLIARLLSFYSCVPTLNYVILAFNIEVVYFRLIIWILYLLFILSPTYLLSIVKYPFSWFSKFMYFLFFKRLKRQRRGTSPNSRRACLLTLIRNLVIHFLFHKCLILLLIYIHLNRNKPYTNSLQTSDSLSFTHEIFTKRFICDIVQK